MHQQRGVVAKAKDDELGPPACVLDAAIADVLEEFRRAGVTDLACPQDLGPLDSVAHDLLSQMAADGLDFGELRHYAGKPTRSGTSCSGAGAPLRSFISPQLRPTLTST